MSRLDELRSMPLEDLRRRFVECGEELPRGGLMVLQADHRAGARDVAAKIWKRIHAAQAEGRRLSRLCAFEQPLWDAGLTLVGGVDEVGMAPLAGPVIAAAVILAPGARIKGVNDSKQLTPAEREALEPDIRRCAVAIGLGRAEVEEIDTINIYHAGLLALRRAVLALTPQPEHLLVDARKLKGLPMPQQPIIKGDAKSLTIGAASIVAKVHRDRLMTELDAQHPGYGFAHHKGYPTAEHFDALERLGACPIHRRSFAPVAKALGLIPEQRELFAPPVAGPPCPTTRRASSGATCARSAIISTRWCRSDTKASPTRLRRTRASSFAATSSSRSASSNRRRSIAGRRRKSFPRAPEPLSRRCSAGPSCSTCATGRSPGSSCTNAFRASAARAAPRRYGRRAGAPSGRTPTRPSDRRSPSASARGRGRRGCIGRAS